ncbi:hypothetical protein ACFS07_35685 [Undibacterium arcticum]
MLLQFSINLSSLRDIRKVSSNGSSAEVPEVDLPINSTQKKYGCALVRLW